MDWVKIFLYTFLKSVPPILLVGVSLRFKLRLSRTSTMVIVLATVLLLHCTSYKLLTLPDATHSVRLIWSIIATIGGVGLYILLFKESMWKILFVFMISRGYMDCTNLVAVGIVEKYFKEAARSLISVELIVTYAVILLVTVIPMWLFLKRVFFPLLDSPAGARCWKYLWLYPLLLYLLSRLSISDIYVDYVVAPDLVIIIPLLWTLASIASYFILLQVILEADRSSRLQERLNIADIQADMQKQQYASIAEEISKTYQARHDLRHHLLAMQGYINSDNLDSLKEYLSAVVKSTEDNVGIICENPAVNIIMWHFSEMARSGNIEVNVSVQLPKKLPISESDFCIVLSNLMENAVEAARKQKRGKRFIKGKLQLVGENKIAIIIKNSYESEVQQNGETFLSTKHAGDGIGTASVCRIARQYGGVTRFLFENGVFEASVLLNY